MNSNLEDFKTGWFGISLGLKTDEIDDLISALEELKKYRTHFHFRSTYEGERGVADIEVYFDEEQSPNNLVLESSCRSYDPDMVE